MPGVRRRDAGEAPTLRRKGLLQLQRVLQVQQSHNGYYFTVLSKCDKHRRAVQTKRYVAFKCKVDEKEDVGGVSGRCTIESKSRKSCKHCRFQRCLRAGMSINLVMNDEERRDRMRVKDLNCKHV